MNAITFGTKRAFHAFLHVTRRPLAAYGLTAARFDMLRAIATAGASFIHQSALRRVLGVTAGVVSRMLRSLEALGLTVRTREPADRRQRRVSLTPIGRGELRVAGRVFLRAARRIVLDAICVGWRRKVAAASIAMAELEGYLDALRRDFGDRATLYFPWAHPDD